MTKLKNKHQLEQNFTAVLKGLGHNVSDEGLVETPRRYIKFLSEFSSPRKFKFTTFEAKGCDEMIVQVGIPVVSLCMHHTLPFTGTAVVGYIPNGRIVGLSKLARTVDFFARRLQTQERITKQVADFIQEKLNPKGVGVILRCEHTCMTIRGAQAIGTRTTTLCLLGAMREDAATRQEFLDQGKC